MYQLWTISTSYIFAFSDPSSWPTLMESPVCMCRLIFSSISGWRPSGFREPFFCADYSALVPHHKSRVPWPLWSPISLFHFCSTAALCMVCPLSALKCGMCFLTRSLNGYGAHLICFLYSHGSQPSAACCPMLENICFIYFLWFPSCLQMED